MKTLTYLLSVVGLSVVLSSVKVRAGLSSLAELLADAMTPVVVQGSVRLPESPIGPDANAKPQQTGLELPEEPAVEEGALDVLEKPTEPPAAHEEAPHDAPAALKGEETDSERVIRVLEIYERGEESEKAAGGS